MAVDATNSLVAEFQRLFGNTTALQQLGSAFQLWRSLTFAEQLGSVMFGADRHYSHPLVDGQVQLRHVHLQPSINRTQDRKKWDAAARQGRERVSDRALIYVANGLGDLLLIHYLKDGTAHDVAAMRNPLDVATMQGCAQVAAAWLADRAAMTLWQQIAQ
jgi:hypothetical protein